MPSGRRYRRFFAELKHRKVFRSAAIYGAGAFGLLQGVDVLVDALRLPTVITTLTALIALAGFPLVCVLGRHEEAVREGRIAIQLDSMSRAANLDHGHNLLRAGRSGKGWRAACSDASALSRCATASDAPFGYLQGGTECIELREIAGQVE